MIGELKGRSWVTKKGYEPVNTDEYNFLLAIEMRDVETVRKSVGLVLPEHPLLFRMMHQIIFNELTGAGVCGKLHDIIKILHAEFGYDLNQRGVEQSPILYHYLIRLESEKAKELIALGANVHAQIAYEKTIDGELLYTSLVDALYRKSMEGQKEYSAILKQLWKMGIDMEELLTKGQVNYKVLEYNTYVRLLAQKGVEVRNHAVGILRQVDWLMDLGATIHLETELVLAE